MKHLIVDIECTCWSKDDPHRDPHETIEIGAVLVDEDFNILGELDLFTLPQFNKRLSQYCIDLTGITQKMLDEKAIPFPAAIEKLKTLIDPETLFCSWGDFDKNQLMKDCESHKIPYPFENHFNIKKEFSSIMHRPRCGLQKACRLMNLRFNGTPHRGIDDAHMIREVFQRFSKIKEAQLDSDGYDFMDKDINGRHETVTLIIKKHLAEKEE